MANIKTCGARLFYSEHGSGTPVILLHASASNGGQWKSLVNHLSRRWKVIVPDLPGYGGSQDPVAAGFRGLESHALAVLDLIEHFGGHAHVVGHSMGGSVAMRLAVGVPECLQSLTVIEPTCFHLLRAGNSTDQDLFGEIQSLSRRVAAAAVDGEVNVGMRRFVDYWNGQGTWAMMQPSQRIKAAQRIGRVTADFSAGLAENWSVEQLRELLSPLVVISGTASPEPAKRTAEVIAGATTNSRHQIITGAGHMLPLTHSMETAALISRTLSGAAAADGGSFEGLKQAA